MIGLTVRWSLAESPADTLDRLRTYVRDESYAKFETVAGLRFKSWRAIDGQWFEGSYVFATTEAREEFQRAFEGSAATSAGSVIVGSAPILIEPCDIVAIAEGPESFVAAATL